MRSLIHIIKKMNNGSKYEEYGINPSKKRPVGSATIGETLGSIAGPGGAVVGAIVGGIIGAIGGPGDT